MSDAAAPAPADDPVIQEWIAGVRIMQAIPAPDGFMPRRWAQAVEDAVAVLRRCGATLWRLGWSTEDVFGLYPDAPGIRVDGWGLAIAANGGEVRDVTPGLARVARPSGSLLTYYRVEMECRVPAWKVGQ